MDMRKRVLKIVTFVRALKVSWQVHTSEEEILRCMYSVIGVIVFTA